MNGEILWLPAPYLRLGAILMADDFPKAAVKHVLDAETLLGMKRYDGAGYLAGYAVECTIKTMIVVETGSSQRLHDLNQLSAKALQLAGLPSHKTGKYLTGPAVTNLIYGPNGWRETLRYEPEGIVSAADATAWVAEARRLYDEIIVPMTLDGVLP